ncbi:MAG: tripartite tricarboxylate transporter substrate binding protein BugD [Acetobacteraceae bacterium]|nr:tripartite tricarboxylate transporter substrate binding protein BugD [Acetobacteraceae bacterium]
MIPASRRALLATALFAPAVARAQGAEYPTRPVTIISAGAAGGPTDTITRIVADALGRQLPQPVVVEATGGSLVAPQKLVNSRPDGYTLMNQNVGLTAAATLYRRLPFAMPGAFAPLGLVSDAAMTVVSRPNFPARTMAELMATLKREGETLNLATAGLSSAANLCGLLLQQAAGAKATTVVFRGTGPAISEVLADRIDLLCDQATNTVPHIRQGRIKAFAVSSPQRLPGLPEVPTTAETGFPSILMSTWHGFYAPTGTPEPIQERLATAITAALRDERLVERFASLLTDVPTPDRQGLAFHRRFFVEEISRWRPIIEAAGAYAD